MKNLMLAATAAAILAVSNSASAATLDYRESVSGDLPTVWTTAPLALEVGANTVRGSRRYYGDDVDFDSFAFELGPNERLTSIEVSWVITELAADTDILAFGLGLRKGSYIDPYIRYQNVNVLGASPVAAFTAILPLTEGAYNLDGGLTRRGTGGVWDYTLTFNVEAASVPEPAVLGLIGLGILGIAGLRRARKA